MTEIDMTHKKSLIASPIAIDGPAASGKGTIAKRLATHLSYDYLDTGLLYRAVGYLLGQDKKSPNDAMSAEHIAQTLDLDLLNDAGFEKHLRTAEAGAAASIVAAMPGVRSAILQAQRDFADNAPIGCILDGRDIGTIVCPNAPHKLFITARADIRAQRRWQELCKQDPSSDFDTVLADIMERDRRDTERATAPLKQAEDAHLLDTSDLSIEEAVSAALNLLVS